MTSPSNMMIKIVTELLLRLKEKSLPWEENGENSFQLNLADYRIDMDDMAKDATPRRVIWLLRGGNVVDSIYAAEAKNTPCDIPGIKTIGTGMDLLWKDALQGSGRKSLDEIVGKIRAL